ncbi:unnamed protein product [Aphanomyces euteiches]
MRVNTKVFQPADMSSLANMAELVAVDHAWKTQAPLDTMTISTTLFEAAFRAFQANLKEQLANYQVVECE